MTSFAAFSDGASVIERFTEVRDNIKTPADKLFDVYEIKKCITWIKEKSLSRVALQFPDELLNDSGEVSGIISRETGAKVFILGDTSYGSCCIDEVAAEHNTADAIIHFGRACLSETQRLPVLFVFTRLAIDTEICNKKLSTVIPDDISEILLLYDVRYHHSAGAIEKALKKRHKNVVVPRLATEDRSTAEENNQRQNTCTCSDIVIMKKLGRYFEMPKEKLLDDYTVIYIGEESISLTNWMINLNKCRFYTYNPVTDVARLETLNVNKMLMKRYYMIERAKDANIIGILAGTLGVRHHLLTLDRLKRLIKISGKKSYTFVVGKINVAKLANFAEIDIYVLIACPENTLIDSSEFYRPVVTPYELEVALNMDRKWTGDYYTDFRELLPGSVGHVEFSSDTSVKPDVSLVTGSVRTLGVEESFTSHVQQDLEERDQILTVANSAEFLLRRNWRGLEEKLGESDVQTAIEGTKGIAASYTHEPSQNS